MTNSPATRSPDPYGVRRFMEAQDPVYNQIKTELTAGAKTSQWMWFIFYL